MEKFIVIKNLSKNQIILPATILIILIIGIIYWISLPKEEVSLPEEITEKEVLEVSSLAGTISEINKQENYLIVRQPKEEKDFKVILSKETEIIQLKFPFDPANPPAEATFTPERIPITIEDLKIGDTISVETSINIFGKAEFDNVSRIQVLP